MLEIPSIEKWQGMKSFLAETEFLPLCTVLKDLHTLLRVNTPQQGVVWRPWSCHLLVAVTPNGTSQAGHTSSGTVAIDYCPRHCAQGTELLCLWALDRTHGNPHPWNFGVCLCRSHLWHSRCVSSGSGLRGHEHLTQQHLYYNQGLCTIEQKMKTYLRPKSVTTISSHAKYTQNIFFSALKSFSLFEILHSEICFDAAL